MAKFGDTAKPAYTTSFQHFMESIEELNYPTEIYRDGYSRVVGAHREHWQALRDGWSEDKDPAVRYRPMSAHPDSIAKAQKQQAQLLADKEAAAAQSGGQKMVSMDQVAAMIADAVNRRPANFSASIPDSE